MQRQRRPGGSVHTLWNSLRAGRRRQTHGLVRVEEAFAQDIHGPGALSPHIEAWAVTALPVPFHAARHLLLRQDDDALSVLRQLVSDRTSAPPDRKSESTCYRLPCGDSGWLSVD